MEEINPDENNIIKPFLFNETFYFKILKSKNFIQGKNILNPLVIKLFEVNYKIKK
jgi:hypothetical protein